MSVEMVDRSGTIRSTEEFANARRVVIERMVNAGGVPQDIELFMEFTTIIQALEIAEVVARKQKSK